MLNAKNHGPSNDRASHHTTARNYQTPHYYSRADYDQYPPACFKEHPAIVVCWLFQRDFRRHRSQPQSRRS